jgi:hypothetical protein
VTADDIRHAAARAKKLNYNRQLPPDVLANLDPDGYGIAWVLMLHEHAQGVEVAPHYRCRVMLKMQNTMEPVEGLMDVPMDIFDGWPSVETIQAWERAFNASDVVEGHDKYGKGKSTEPGNRAA